MDSELPVLFELNQNIDFVFVLGKLLLHISPIFLFSYLFSRRSWKEPFFFLVFCLLFCLFQTSLERLWIQICRCVETKPWQLPGRKQNYKKEIRARPAECDPDVATSVIERQMKIFACSDHVENAHQPSNLANARMRCLLNHAELDLPPQRVSTIARYDLLHALLT